MLRMTTRTRVYGFTLSASLLSVLSSALLSGCGPSVANAASAGADAQGVRPEPFAGDVVNNSPYRVLIWGDNIPGADANGYLCLPAGENSHRWSGSVDVDFAYSSSRRQWCKIGAGEARIGASGFTHCPSGWQDAPFLTVRSC